MSNYAPLFFDETGYVVGVTQYEGHRYIKLTVFRTMLSRRGLDYLIDGVTYLSTTIPPHPYVYFIELISLAAWVRSKANIGTAILIPLSACLDDYLKHYFIDEGQGKAKDLELVKHGVIL
jgi:hypothetical protein